MKGPVAVATMLAIVLTAAGCTSVADPEVREDITTTTARPGEDGPIAVTFSTADDFTLEARLFSTGDGSDTEWVILAHMRPTTMDAWFDLAAKFAERGYTAFAFNYRGYGASTGARSPYRVDVDTVAAVDYAVAHGATAVWLIGASMGGVGALAASAQRTVAGVATLSAPLEYEGVDGLTAAAATSIPKLFIASAGDGDYPLDAVRLRDASPGNADVRVLEGSGAHGTDMLTQYPEIAPYTLISFVEGGSG